jgi:DMSO/TMAO reductase YedYZ molybdopterin-dependent catalytic subunit
VAPLAVGTTALEPIAARAVSRRRFLVEMGGLVATIAVVGAGVSEVLAAQSGPKVQQSVNAPIPFPNRNSLVKPVPGTRPEYTAVADHYTVDIDFSPPNVDGNTWRLLIDGLVTKSLSLSLDRLKSGFKAVDRFITISCISNPVGGDLIGTTLWTGVALRDVLAQAHPESSAKYVHMVSEDGFYETADLAMVEADERVMLVHAWNGQPLPAAHGFPLRIYIPDVYGMKQPKWIKQLSVTATQTSGYWVDRGWDAKAEVQTTSVIDTVATGSVVMKGGRTYVPVGGIAYSGAKGISKVEVKVDEGPWEPAQLRAPLSNLTWVIWRYEWPFSPGEHVFYVRAYDGGGRLQVTEAHDSLPSGATGLSAYQATIPAKL